jgi:hypothetical protein
LFSVTIGATSSSPSRRRFVDAARLSRRLACYMTNATVRDDPSAKADRVGLVRGIGHSV